MLQSHFMAFVNLRGGAADEATVVLDKSMSASKNKPGSHFFICRRDLQPHGK